MAETEILKLALGGANTYLLKGANGCILVDAGLRGAGKKLTARLEKTTTGPEDIKLIVITHNHYDHIGGLEEVRKLTKAPVAMHKDEALASHDVKPGKNNESSLVFKLIVNLLSKITPSVGETVKADINILKNMDLHDYGISAKIIHTPGHSPGSVCIITDDGKCIAGDTLFNIFPGSNYPIIVYDRIKLAKTYQRLNDIGCKIYYPGHGKPISKDRFIRRIINNNKYMAVGGHDS